ncbi:hypothetical protein AG1IA_06538 [Rhizoctonia solani AG-1 IA]|uniref:Uncharacterized protein n=1 Tax=Thanatephorus cucumeris (strain AG1-IA) TaxID=983506 RepID=L8WRQ6_THACA|nr:hypothetical protein AG1IA_06538 [Rhizoctonia solani AG-1 IA]
MEQLVAYRVALPIVARRPRSPRLVVDRIDILSHSICITVWALAASRSTISKVLNVIYLHPYPSNLLEYLKRPQTEPGKRVQTPYGNAS